MGGNRTFVLSQREFSDAQEGAYWLGVEHGMDTASENLREEIREEVRRELEDEIAATADCPMCQLRKRLAELQHELEVERGRRRDAEARQRGHAITHGTAPYRETKEAPRDPGSG